MFPFVRQTTSMWSPRGSSKSQFRKSKRMRKWRRRASLKRRLRRVLLLRGQGTRGIGHLAECDCMMFFSFGFVSLTVWVKQNVTGFKMDGFKAPGLSAMSRRVVASVNWPCYTLYLVLLQLWHLRMQPCGSSTAVSSRVF